MKEPISHGFMISRTGGAAGRHFTETRPLIGIFLALLIIRVTKRQSAPGDLPGGTVASISNAVHVVAVREILGTAIPARMKRIGLFRVAVEASRPRSRGNCLVAMNSSSELVRVNPSANSAGAETLIIKARTDQNDRPAPSPTSPQVRRL